MAINNCNLLIHTCAKLFILGSLLNSGKFVMELTNKSQFDICPFLSPLVHCSNTVFVSLFFWHSLLSQQSLSTIAVTAKMARKWFPYDSYDHCDR